MQVLIAEDNFANQFLFQEMCRAAGVEAVVAGDGEAAVAAVAAGDFDLVLMDIHMPKLSGIDATIQIRRLPGKRGQILIFALTADVTSETARACRAAGVNEILTKPPRPGQLLSILTTLKISFGTRPPPALAADPPERTGAFENRLKAIIAGSTVAVAGRVNLLGLARIKQHFGDGWPRVAENAERVVRLAIERRLSPADTYSKADDFEFIVVFGDMTPSEGQLKCAAIAEEIVRKLVGEEGASLIEVKAAAVQVDGTVEFETVDSRKALAALLRAQSESGVRPADGPIAAAPDPGKRRAIDPSVPDPLAGMEILYRPVWDSLHKTVAAFHCLPFVRRTDIRGRPEQVPLRAERDVRIMTTADKATQSFTKAAVAALLTQTERLLVSCPVHYETLASAARRADYAHGLDDFPKAGLRRFMIEVIDVPCGVVPARLHEILAPLRARGAGIIVGVELHFRDFAAIKANDIHLIGTDISAHPGSDLSLIYRIKQFQFAAQQAGLTAYLRGIGSAKVLDAVRNKFRFLDGDAVAPVQLFVGASGDGNAASAPSPGNPTQQARPVPA